MRRRSRGAWGALALLMALSAAPVSPARAEEDPAAEPAAPGRDPWEPLNRKTFWLNEQLDRFLLEPVAIAWDTVLPDPVQTSIRGVYNHMRFPVIVVNDALQLKGVAVAEDIGRFAINTLWGLFGIWDAAGMVGLEAHDEDFGQTLGYWGVPSGPYLVLPFFGPSSPRDTVGLAVDAGIVYGAWFAAGIPIYASASMYAVDVANRRSLIIDDVREERAAAFDWYVFVRNAYIQNRQKKVQDALDDESEPTSAPEEDLYYLDDEEEETIQ